MPWFKIGFKVSILFSAQHALEKTGTVPILIFGLIPASSRE